MSQEEQLEVQEQEAPAAEREAEKEEPRVDEIPEVDLETLRAEVEKLEEKKKKAQQDWYYWREQAAKKRVRAGGEEDQRQPVQPQIKASVAEPRESQFETYDDYIKALADYRSEMKFMELEDRRRRQMENERVAEKQQTFWTKMQEGFQKFDDFEEIAFAPTVPITQQMSEIIMETDHAADIAYYLGKNIKDCVEISRMTPTQAARAIGKIEAEIVNQPIPQHGKKSTTKAPPPIRPVAGGSGVISKDPKKMSYQEYVKWRMEGGGR